MPARRLCILRHRDRQRPGRGQSRDYACQGASYPVTITLGSPGAAPLSGYACQEALYLETVRGRIAVLVATAVVMPARGLCILRQLKGHRRAIHINVVMP